MNNTVVKQNRRTLILTLLAFALPAALAYLVHVTGFWQMRGTVNNGVLINPPINFDQLTLTPINTSEARFDRQSQWWLVYAGPETCGKACENSLMQIRQTQAATGPEQKRVSMLYVAHQNSDPKALQWVKENAPEMVMVSVDQTQWQELMTGGLINQTGDISNAGQIFVVDPMGAVFMTYPAVTDEQQAIQQGKGLLKDLKRVLKLSRIG